MEGEAIKESAAKYQEELSKRQEQLASGELLMVRAAGASCYAPLY